MCKWLALLHACVEKVAPVALLQHKQQTRFCVMCSHSLLRPLRTLRCELISYTVPQRLPDQVLQSAAGGLGADQHASCSFGKAAAAMTRARLRLPEV